MIFQGEAGPSQSAELVAGAVKEISQSSMNPFPALIKSNMNKIISNKKSVAGLSMSE